MEIIYSVIFSLCAGVLPALLWLWFWLHEDRAHPEPRSMIIRAVFGGMIAVIVSLILEKIAHSYIDYGTTLIIVWAIIEEFSKYAVAWWLVLRNRENDEPIDSVIYLITIALGFSALENTLFLFTPFIENNIPLAAATSQLRFIGSTLLHLIASSAIGISLAFTFKKPFKVRAVSVIIGLIIASALHSLFNLFIIYGGNSGMILTFTFVWFAIVILILLFEKIKRIRY